MIFFNLQKKGSKPPTLIGDAVRLVECVSRSVNRSVQFVLAVAVASSIKTRTTSPVVSLFAEELTFHSALVAFSKDLLVLLLTLIPFPLCWGWNVGDVGGIFPLVSTTTLVVVVRWVSAVKAVCLTALPISVSVVVSAENSAVVILVLVGDALSLPILTVLLVVVVVSPVLNLLLAPLSQRKGLLVKPLCVGCWIIYLAADALAIVVCLAVSAV